MQRLLLIDHYRGLNYSNLCHQMKQGYQTSMKGIDLQKLLHMLSLVKPWKPRVNIIFVLSNFNLMILKRALTRGRSNDAYSRVS